MDEFYRQYLTSHATARLNWTRDSTGNWSGSIQKRVFDFVSAGLALILLCPFLLLAALAVKLTSRGPVLFTQRRMGRAGQEFVIYKLRTMRVQSPGEGPSVTRKGDSRLTPAGAFLRRSKIDEIPQLFNVLKGDMSLVGARPKLPHHQTYALKYRPGITGAASLAFRNEEGLLNEVTHESLDEYQIHVMMPVKKHLDQAYMAHASFVSDIRILAATVLGRGDRLDCERLESFQHSLVSLGTALRGDFPAVSPVAPARSEYATDTACQVAQACDI